MTVTIAQLPLAALEALAAGDADAAATHSPVPLSGWLTGRECLGTWRRRAVQVAATPTDEAWVTGVVLADGVPVGRAGFHAAPDTDGVLEVGYAIDPDHRRRGHARALLGVLLDRARETPGVRRVLASVGPWNEPSLRLVRSRGFVQVGEQMDEEDGLELVLALDVAPRPVGTDTTRLVVVRGNSGSGKSTVARALQAVRPRDLAWVGQDLLRREVLRGPDVQGGVTVDLVDATARFALDRGFHVVVDGILGAHKHGTMLRCLARDHAGASHAYLLDVPFEETVRRHATKPVADGFGTEEMREWYHPTPLVPGLDEAVIGPESSAEATLARVRAETGL